jgi:hypothetical protein
MEADYRVELGPAAPALELPWTDPEGCSHYVELRGAASLRERSVDGKPDRITDGIADHIPEARRFPALGRFLVDANSQPSAWQTAKCDVWADQTEAMENLYNAGFAHSSYVDLVLAEPAAALRGSLEAHQRLAKEMAQRLEANASLEALAEIVVRRCYFHPGASLEESDAGYCLTLFLIGYGATPGEAAECWERTLEFAAECLLQLQPREESAQKTELG